MINHENGQVLVVFLLLLPVLILLFAALVDMGLIALEVRKTENTIQEALREEENFQQDDDETKEAKLQKFLEKNNQNITNLEVQVTSDKIIIRMKKEVKGTFRYLFLKNIYQIDTTFTKENGKIIKER